MQMKNWNDLRYLLAIKRGRSLAAAARLVGVDDTTVSRRLAALQSVSGTPLYRRLGDGSLELTPDGETVVSHAEQIEHHVDQIAEALGAGEQACTGSVRLTSVPIVVNRLLTPRLGALLAEHPKLEVHLIPDARDFSLTRREADLALRLARPRTGGTSVKARRIGQLDYAVYASGELSPQEAATLPWITYDDTMAHLPQAHWISRAAKGQMDSFAGLRVLDAETALEAVRAGLGRTLLPAVIADDEVGLRELAPESDMKPLSREVWLLAHADQLTLRRISAVIGWVEQAFRSERS